MRIILPSVLIFLVAACEAAPPPAAEQPALVHPGAIMLGYVDTTVSDLGPFYVAGLNDRGDLVGSRAGTMAYRWTRARGLEHLTAGGGTSEVRDINNTGTAAGSVRLDGQPLFPNRAAVWGPDGRVRVLPQPDGWRQSRARAINEAGVVAGRVDHGRSFVWWPGSEMRLLPPIGVPRDSVGDGIYSETVAGVNEAGDVLGAYVASCARESLRAECAGTDAWTGAAVWKASGQMVRLFDSAAVERNTVFELNDAGTVVGCSDGRPALWNAQGVRRLLGPAGCATGINEAGVVVGYVERFTLRTAFRWTADGGLEDLGTLGGAESEARDVNEAGDVTGWAEARSGERRAFVWTAEGGMQAVDASAASEGRFINRAREVAGQSTRDTASHATRWSGAEARARVARAP